MIVRNAQLEKLANIIVSNLKEEFEIKHLSKNLINTIKISYNNEEVRIEIPAQTYNMLLYQQQGVVVHTSHGSYASKLDKEGSSFMVYPGEGRKGSYKTEPGNHKGYIDKIIHKSLSQFIAQEHLEVKSKEDSKND